MRETRDSFNLKSVQRQQAWRAQASRSLARLYLFGSNLPPPFYPPRLIGARHACARFCGASGRFPPAGLPARAWVTGCGKAATLQNRAVLRASGTPQIYLFGSLRSPCRARRAVWMRESCTATAEQPNSRQQPTANSRMHACRGLRFVRQWFVLLPIPARMR